MRKSLWLVVLTAVAFPVIAAADPGVSGGTLSHPSFEASAPAGVVEAPPLGATLAPPTVALTTPFVGGVRYRPRAYRSPESVMPLTTQVHLGFFDPNNNFGTGFDGGFRIGPQVDPHVQIGLAVDWWHRSDDTVLDVGTIQGPIGSSTELVLSQTTADLVPFLAFVQVSGDENMPVIPYGGFGIGYECLFLTSDDYVTQESFNKTFGGFGWQAWAGAGLPLDGHTRLNGEVFYNGSEVGSDEDTYIADYGLVRVRDVIKMNGVGMRFGVSWGF